MDGPVHPNESWLPSCVSNDDERVLNTKDAGQHVPPTPTTYTQLKSVCNQVNTTSSSVISGVNMLKSPDVDIISLGDQKESNLKNLRPHSTPATLLWLEENYETAEGVCIPRSTLYMHYVDFCDRNGMQPVNAASFGKIIRQQFPHLTTRRLGTRGQSRYHYYGIAVKESSTYYDVSYSKRGGSSLHESKKEPLKQTPTYSQRTKIGALLPDFTHFKDLNLPPNIPEEKVSTFLMMYRTHCQRILDTVIRASFDEVQNFLLHFWKGMPSHISSILSSNAIVNVVGVCDSFVYKAISNVLFPSVHQALPDSLIQVIRKFSKDLTVWLRMALDDIPDNLRELKFDLAKCFSRTLRRQTSLNHLCQASRLVIHNSDITAQMLQDWRNVDLDGVSRQTLFTMDGQTDIGGATVELITSLYKEFETLLEDQAPIEAYMEWLESLVDRCVVQPSRKRKCSIRRLARQFLLMWSSFGTRVIRDMTLHSAPSFGSFHLLHLTFDDYVLFLVESLHWEERTQELFANIPNDAPPTLNDTMIDDAVVDSEVGMCKLKWYSSQPHGGAEHAVSTSSMPIASPSSHSHASSCDVMAQNSPVQNPLDSNMSINDDAKPPETPGGDTEPMITEYTPMTPDQYPSSYHYDTQDNRGLYNYSAAAAVAGGVGGRQESRSTYSCHPGNQYIMNNPGVETQDVDCTGARNLVATNTPRSNGETIGNGNVEYANFVQYPSSRRGGDYSECHGYVYEQPATSIIYTPTNCYYQPYEVTGNATTLCCSPRYPIRSESTSPNKMERGGNVEPKLQEGGSGIIYSVTSTGNGRG